MPSGMFSVSINTKQPPEPKAGDREPTVGIGPPEADAHTASKPEASITSYVFDAIMEAVGAELARTLEELQAQHGRLQQRAVRQAVSQAAAQLALQRPASGGHPSAREGREEQPSASPPGLEGRAAAKSGLAFVELPPVEVDPGLGKKAGGRDGTSWVLGPRLGRSPRPPGACAGTPGGFGDPELG
ncbi:unnamed protein product [Prorocentrum cordatum]|uniref:Uncharacterized protein n=1 Tax=Prorocentrum cordatum TaxID=2364126 RepID=A0ABN9XZC8_9DINO|nr:unnamed protein product [Polarella glacialis]